jgi:nucleolysin TIA-1/TIAR
MSPQGERHRRKIRYRNTQSNARAGPSPGGQPFAQTQQQGFGGPAMAQPYQQMPQSAGGYGRGQQPQQQWGGQPTQGNFGGQNGFQGGYQG